MINVEAHHAAHYCRMGNTIPGTRLGVCGELGSVRFLVVYFLYKTNQNPRNNICCGKKWPKCHFSPNFFWVGLALGWGVRRFHDNIGRKKNCGGKKWPKCHFSPINNFFLGWVGLGLGSSSVS